MEHQGTTLEMFVGCVYRREVAVSGVSGVRKSASVVGFETNPGYSESVATSHPAAAGNHSVIGEAQAKILDAMKYNLYLLEAMKYNLY